jgi:hypothetical protein
MPKTTSRRPRNTRKQSPKQKPITYWKRISYHEAGHAVADVILGCMTFERVTLETITKEVACSDGVHRTISYIDGVVYTDANGKEATRRCRAGDPNEETARMAGPEAEVALVGRIDEPARYGATLDITPIAEDRLDAAADRAREFVSAWWGAIDLVAMVLRERGMLLHCEVVNLIDAYKEHHGLDAA